MVNCEHRVNPSNKLCLSTECTGGSCTNKLLYSWTLSFLETREGQKPTWQHDNVTLKTQDISSSGSFPNIVIKKNKLRDNKHYKLVVTGTLANGIFGRASYTFQVNDSPRDGKCNVEPRVGHVLTTEYKFWCTGWHDPNGPLKYRISHVQGMQESLLNYGGDAEATVSLPLGDGENYTINIAIHICDRLGAATLFRLQVQVRMF